MASFSKELQPEGDGLLNGVEAVLAGLEEGVSIQDRNYRVLYQNGRHRELAGDHVGEHCYRAYGKREEVCEDCPLTMSLQDGLIHRVEKAVNALGVHVSITSSPCRDADGKIVGGIEVVRDITEQKKLQAQLEQKSRLEAMENLAGSIAHNFNNLLTVIIGNAHRLQLADRPDAFDLAGQIQQAGGRAASLTKQLLAFSRRQVFKAKVLDLNRILLDTEKMLRPLVDENIKVRLNLAPGLGRIKADQIQIERMVMNLLLNARDAMPEGGSITVSTRNVGAGPTVVAGVPSRWLVLEIADTGQGMDKETQAHVFEPFFSTKSNQHGSGLGLAMVYGIVMQSGGWINVESAPGKGASFKLHFPVTSEAPADTPEVAFSAATILQNILLVEDEPAIRKTITQVLERVGYTVLSAGSGEEALRIFEQHRFSIDLLLTDIMLPGINGSQLAEQLVSRRPGLPILYMSGCPTGQLCREKALQPGIKFLPKPFGPDELLQVIDQFRPDAGKRCSCAGRRDGC